MTKVIIHFNLARGCYAMCLCMYDEKRVYTSVVYIGWGLCWRFWLPRSVTFYRNDLNGEVDVAATSLPANGLSIHSECVYISQARQERKKNIPQLTIGENALTHNYTAFLASSAALSLLSSCKHLFRQQWLNERLIGQRLVAVRIAGIHSFCGTSFARSLWQRAGVRTR